MSPPLGRVVQFPVRQGVSLAESTTNTTRAVFRRVTEEPPGHVDDWGRDAGLFRLCTILEASLMQKDALSLSDNGALLYTSRMCSSCFHRQ